MIQPIEVCACGSRFQAVEDLPLLYRTYELVDGVLVFEPEAEEKSWDEVGHQYCYVECRTCLKRIRRPFRFRDDAENRGEVYPGEI